MHCTVEILVLMSLWNTIVSHFSLSHSEELFQLLHMVPDLLLSPSLLPVWSSKHKHKEYITLCQLHDLWQKNIKFFCLKFKNRNELEVLEESLFLFNPVSHFKKAMSLFLKIQKILKQPNQRSNLLQIPVQSQLKRIFCLQRKLLSPLQHARYFERAQRRDSELMLEKMVMA